MTMNDPTPFSPEQIDELISADLDGEFDAAARDLGFDPVSARVALDAQPGAAERRTSMRAARAHLSEMPELDEMVAARLRAKAVREAERSAAPARAGRGRWYAAMAAVAAALAIVVGIAFAIKHSPVTRTSGESKRAVVAAPAQPPQLSGTLGRFPDARSLVARARVEAQRARSVPSSNTSSNSGALSPSTAALSCAGAAQRWAGVSIQPELAAPATIAGAPVEVFVYRSGTEEIVVVTSPAPECGLMAHDVAPASSP